MLLQKYCQSKKLNNLTGNLNIPLFLNTLDRISSVVSLNYSNAFDPLKSKFARLGIVFKNFKSE